MAEPHSERKMRGRKVGWSEIRDSATVGRDEWGIPQ